MRWWPFVKITVVALSIPTPRFLLLFCPRQIIFLWPIWIWIYICLNCLLVMTVGRRTTTRESVFSPIFWFKTSLLWWLASINRFIPHFFTSTPASSVPRLLMCWYGCLGHWSLPLNFCVWRVAFVSLFTWTPSICPALEIHRLLSLRRTVLSWTMLLYFPAWKLSFNIALLVFDIS